jgi:hypothetical protein
VQHIKQTIHRKRDNRQKPPTPTRAPPTAAAPTSP